MSRIPNVAAGLVSLVCLPLILLALPFASIRRTWREALVVAATEDARRLGLVA